MHGTQFQPALNVAKIRSDSPDTQLPRVDLLSSTESVRFLVTLKCYVLTIVALANSTMSTKRFQSQANDALSLSDLRIRRLGGRKGLGTSCLTERREEARFCH